MVKTICIFGDSTAWGAWDMEKGGWVNRLWLSVGSRDNNDDWVEIYNQSVSGGTTDTILARLESEAKIREATHLIFQSGGNDSFLEGKNGPNKIPLDKFRENIQSIIDKSREISEGVMFIGFKNVDESKTMPVAWEDIYYINSEIQKYDQVMKDVCERNRIPYLDIFGLLEKEDFEDGIHPNAKGHEKIFVKARNFLKKLGWI